MVFCLSEEQNPREFRKSCAGFWKKLVKSILESGESILISSFGKFEVKEKRKRRGRNPQTGEDLMLDGRRVITFKCSGVLKDKMNG